MIQSLMGRCALVLPAVILAMAFVTLVIASPARAHDQVVSQTPLEGQHIAEAPSEITLTFSNTPLEIGLGILVVDADSKNWAMGVPAIYGNTVSQPVSDELPDGNYQVRWRVVSVDGHPISSSFRFSVGDVAAFAPLPQVSAAGQQTLDQRPPGTESEGQGEPTANGDGSDLTVTPSSSTRTLIFAVGGATLAAASFASVQLAKIRRSRTKK